MKQRPQLSPLVSTLSGLVGLTLMLTFFSASPSEAVTTPRLLSTWSSFNSDFSISEIDPKTGNTSQQLISVAEYVQLGPGNPALDYQNQRAYFALIGALRTSIPPTLVGFDLSSSDSAKVILQAPLPQSDNLFTVFDYVTNRVYLASLAIAEVRDAAPVITMGYVDLVTGRYVNVTVFPEGVSPASAGIGQTPAVLYPVTRAIVMFTFFSGSNTYGLTSFNLDTSQFTSIPFAWTVNSMVYESVTEQIFALVSSNSGTSLNTTAVTLDPTTGKVNILNIWKNLGLVTPVGSIATYDAWDNVVYTVMGSQEGPSVALTSVSTQTGALLNAAYFQDGQGNQPASIFFV